MFAQFRYLDGPQNGEIRVVGNDFATIGRDPSADVRFDPEQDIEISIRHAAVFKQGGGFLIRDLGSTNGTFLNGARVRGDRPLEVGDVIQLGPNGPRIEFGAATTPPHATRAAAADARAAPRAIPSEIYRPKPRPTGRVGQIRSPRRTGWRWLIAAVVVVGAAIGAVTGYRARRAATAALESRRAALEARIDELRGRLDQAASPLPGLSAAITAAKEATDDLRVVVGRQVTGAGLDSAATRLDALTTLHQPALAASGFDPAATRAAVAGRVAAVIGEFDRGRVVTATAFVVHRAADTVWLATTRSVATDSGGRPAGRYPVIFAGARVALLGRLVRTDDSLRVALLAVTLSDPPSAVAVAEVPAAGTPVAQVGFPFGADSLGGWRQSGAALSASLATLTATASAVGLETYGNRVWPGSAVVTGAGTVIGMVSDGGRGARVVPMAAVLRLLTPR